ncbi:MAG: lipopolysaccharide biosynthesis protein [Vibrionaceae bacterium]|nr:lipopolysaccharide biosynthesis protein [Vibrionaceae bacterium]
MSGLHKQPLSQTSCTPQIPDSYQTNDEIDLRELFKVLWEGKLIIIAAAAIFALSAAGYALIQPNIYQASSSFLIEEKVYNITEAEEPIISPELIISGIFKKQIVAYYGEQKKVLSDVYISYDERSQVYSISKLSSDPESAFEGVSAMTEALNIVLKKHELNKIDLALDALQSNASSKSVPSKTQEYLDELFAKQLFMKAMLENPNTELAKVFVQPSKPTSHVKPKRAIIIVLGTLLGGMIGFVIVLIRFMFTQQVYKDKSKSVI